MTAQEAVSHWEKLATEADNFGVYEVKNGRYGGVCFNRARTYRAAAESLRLEATTGVPHCSCCLKPRKPSP